MRRTSAPSSPSKADGSDLDPRTVKALSHPLRHRILSRLNEKVASPKELAEEFGEPLNRLSYHVRTLEELECIELVSTTPRRGAVEHHYRALVRPFFSDDDWIALPASSRRSIIDQHLRRISRDVAAAAGADGFSREDVHVSWTPLDLDEQGMNDLDLLLGATLEQALQIHADSTARRIAEGAGPAQLATELVMLHFLRAPVSPGGRRSGG
jgi:DNA-binding transcriptional ArsR family regulator